MKRCLLIGDLILDYYKFYTTMSKNSHDFKKQKCFLGGAGNVYLILKYLHVNVDIGTYVNDIAYLGVLSNSFIKNLYSVKNITKKYRSFLGDKQIFSSSQEYIHNFSGNELFLNIKNNIKLYNLIVISDYLKGVCNSEFMRAVVDLAKEHHIPVILDTKLSIKFNKTYPKVDYLKINYKEFKNLFCCKLTEKELIRSIMGKYNISNLIVTLDKRGSVFYSVNDIILYQCSEVVNGCSIGSGDAYFAKLICCICNNYDILTCIKESTEFAKLYTMKHLSYRRKI